MKEYGGFGPQDYTADGTLRVGWLLWLILAFLTRHWMLLVMGAVTALVGSPSGAGASDSSALYSGPWYLLTSLPALALLAAAARRQASSGRPVRWLWQHGRWLLLAAALGDLALLIATGYGRLTELSELHIVGGLLDLYILAYLLRSRRLRRRFADFPPSPG